MLFARQSVMADCRAFSDLIDNGGYGVAGVDGRVIASCNADRPFIPASIVKIPTALAALHLLGPDYRFVTEFFLDPEQNLYIRGGGDPLLTSEEVERIAVRLRSLGIDRIRGVFVDQGAYALAGDVPGRGGSDNPYDAPVAATAVNFNTVAVTVEKDGRIGSAEAQTPYLPIMRELGAGLGPGRYRLNICRRQCAADEQSARYAAELFRAKCRETGIACGDLSGMRKAPAGARPVYVHRSSRTLEQVVAACLRYSNNFMANQVFLACGAAKYGYPATWNKAERAVAETLAATAGAGAVRAISMVEGAGLSRANRVTAGAMLDILRAFRPYSHLLGENSRTGVKSGTMSGIYNLAGYTRNGDAFVILLNQRANNRDRIRDRLEHSALKR